MDSNPGGMHIEIIGERKVIHDNSALSGQRSKQGMRAIVHASFVTPSPPKAIAQARGSINLIAVHFVSGDKVLLHLADDGFPKLTEALFDRSQ